MIGNDHDVRARQERSCDVSPTEEYADDLLMAALSVGRDEWIDCDVCGRYEHPDDIELVIAYGIETYACPRCRRGTKEGAA